MRPHPCAHSASQPLRALATFFARCSRHRVAHRLMSMAITDRWGRHQMPYRPWMEGGSRSPTPVRSIHDNVTTCGGSPTRSSSPPAGSVYMPRMCSRGSGSRPLGASGWLSAERQTVQRGVVGGMSSRVVIVCAVLSSRIASPAHCLGSRHVGSAMRNSGNHLVVASDSHSVSRSTNFDSSRLVSYRCTAASAIAVSRTRSRSWWMRLGPRPTLCKWHGPVGRRARGRQVVWSIRRKKCSAVSRDRAVGKGRSGINLPPQNFGMKWQEWLYLYAQPEPANIELIPHRVAPHLVVPARNSEKYP